MKNRTLIGLLSLTLTAPLAALAADFTIPAGTAETALQSLDTNGDTGIVEAGASLTTASNAINIQQVASGSKTTRVINRGAIQVTGGTFQAGAGVQSTASNSDIYNAATGTITTVGYGITSNASTARNAKITNAGKITTTGDTGYGIHSTGANATITNRGVIATSGDESDGLYSTGAAAVVNNAGQIIITGDGESSGVRIRGANATAGNTGEISTLGAGSHGIYATGTVAVVTNAGNITTFGAGSHGIQSSGSDATIAHSGTITTFGAGSHGIDATGANADITISGRVAATGAGSHAVNAGDSVTLTLRGNYALFGTLDLGDSGDTDIDTVNIYGAGAAGASQRLTFTNAEAVNVMQSASNLLCANTICDTIDPTGESSRSLALTQLTAPIHGVISHRMATPPPIQRWHGGKS